MERINRFWERYYEGEGHEIEAPDILLGLLDDLDSVFHGGLIFDAITLHFASSLGTALGVTGGSWKPHGAAEHLDQYTSSDPSQDGS